MLLSSLSLSKKTLPLLATYLAPLQVDVYACPQPPSLAASPQLLKCHPSLGPMWRPQQQLPSSSRHMHRCNLAKYLLRVWVCLRQRQ